MKLTQQTMNVLKSFSTINPSILFREGVYLATVSSSKTIMARAKLDQAFDKSFAIYDLSRFLGALSLFKEPELTFGKDQVKIASDKQKIHYTYADPETILSASDKEPKVPSMDVRCSISYAVLKSTQNACSILGVSEIAIVGDGEKIYIQAFSADDKETNKNVDLYSVEIGETTKEFLVVFKVDYLKFLPLDYQVTVSSKGISHWKGEYVDYWLAVEKKSDFTKL